MEEFKRCYMDYTGEPESACNVLDNIRYSTAYRMWQAATERAVNTIDAVSEKSAPCWCQSKDDPGGETVCGCCLLIEQFKEAILKG